MNLKTELQTERLLLRPWKIDDVADAKALFKYASNPHIGPAAAWPVHASVEEAAQGADFVQENAPERLDIKRQVYAGLESVLGPDVIIASSTSGIMPSTLQEGMQHPERLVVGHPFNPPHLIPLVEVVPGKQTSEATVQAVLALYRALGKTPIRLRREVVGHIANRLQAAIWREAVYLAREGVASVEDIDLANRISSQRLANAHITYAGRGALADANQTGWLTRFFNSSLSPF